MKDFIFYVGFVIVSLLSYVVADGGLISDDSLQSIGLVTVCGGVVIGYIFIWSYFFSEE